jgi:hypothetical protein
MYMLHVTIRKGTQERVKCVVKRQRRVLLNLLRKIFQLALTNSVCASMPISHTASLFALILLKLAVQMVVTTMTVIIIMMMMIFEISNS